MIPRARTEEIATTGVDDFATYPCASFWAYHAPPHRKELSALQEYPVEKRACGTPVESRATPRVTAATDISHSTNPQAANQCGPRSGFPEHSLFSIAVPYGQTYKSLRSECLTYGAVPPVA